MNATILDHVTYNFACDDGPDAALKVHRMRLREHVDGLYELALDLVSEDTDLDTEPLLGAGCRLDIIRGERWRTLFGIIDRVQYAGFSDDRLLFGVRVVPAVGLLAQNVHSRIFQGDSVLDIVQRVLNDGLMAYGRTGAVAIGAAARGTTSRDYCVQYRETDLDFVTRLLEEEGISYHFAHDEAAGHEVMTLTYENTDFSDVENVDGSPTVPISGIASDELGRESIVALEYERMLVPTAVVHMDFDPMRPADPIIASAAGQDERGRLRRVYRHDQRRHIAGDLAERATDEQKARALRGKVGHGTSNMITLRPCGVFEVERHDREDLEHKWAVIGIEHWGECPDVVLGRDGGSSRAPSYSNRFTCVPLDVPVRPLPRTPKPRAYGPETATVVGPRNEEIHVDEQGRIKVQFHWEEGGLRNDTSSCWMRVRQPWAGPGWGFQFIPRMGMEVVVEFLGGNPDRPMVNGCVYNGANGYPYPMPDEKTKSAIKTSSVGGEGSNELRFEDGSGIEEIYVHAQKDMNTKVGNDQTLAVVRDRSIEIGRDLRDVVVRHRAIEVGGNHDEHIHGNVAIQVAKNVSETVLGRHDRTIAKGSRVEVQLAAEEVVGAKKTVAVGGLYSETVGASRSIRAGHAMSFSAGSSGKFRCARNMMLKAGKNLDIDAGDDLSLQSSKKTSIRAGDNLSVTGDKKAQLDITEELVIKCGRSQIRMKKDGTIEFEGKDITFKGSGKISLKAEGDVVIKGAKVSKN